MHDFKHKHLRIKRATEFGVTELLVGVVIIVMIILLCLKNNDYLIDRFVK